MKNITAFVLVVMLIGFGIWFAQTRMATTNSTLPPDTSTSTGGKLLNNVVYACNAKKTIIAAIYARSASIVLSDGRKFTLPQTISADGARYSNGDPNTQGSETFVFWSKGNGAMVLENNQDQTYTGCIEVAPQPAGSDLSQVYENGANGFSLRYPQGYMLNEENKNQVRFTIPGSITTNTNLSTDTYIAVEKIPQSKTCTADLFFDNKVQTSTVTDSGTTYSYATYTGAAAGNRYETVVYALPGTNPCMAVVYLIHYGVLDNYPPGEVQAFDEVGLKKEFDSIRHTLIINQ